ncbi:MAG: hypothetical protein HY584_05115 [Candidatus Omnitrophica bacterium]|nr:hypothetical protein [Candidatus Omnitrophota bacterium]
MKSPAPKTRFLWITTGIFLILGVGLIRWQEDLKLALDDSRRQYQDNLDLLRFKDAHSSAYARIIESGKLPQAKPFQPNVWIQVTQKAVGEANLSLEELRPEREGKKAEGNRLFLVVEGKMADLLDFFYRIATDNHLVYIKEFSLSLVQEDSDVLRAQMTLAQM